MDDPVAYRSKVRIERVKGPLRRAYLPAEEQPTLFGVYSEIAQHRARDGRRLTRRIHADVWYSLWRH
jgi:hypothetical protein